MAAIFFFRGHPYIWRTTVYAVMINQQTTSPRHVQMLQNGTSHAQDVVQVAGLIYTVGRKIS